MTRAPLDAEPPRASAGKRGLLQQFSWTLPANIFFGATQCLLLVVLNQFGSPTVVGQFGLALSITAPLFLLANLRLATLIATDTGHTIYLRDYLRIRVVCVWAALVATGLGLLVAGQTDLGLLIVLIALVKAAEAATDFCHGVQQRLGRVDRIAWSLFASGTLTLAGFTAAYVTTTSLCWGVVGLLVGRLLALACYDLPVCRQAARLPVFGGSQHLASEQRRTHIGLIVRQALPLGVTAVIISLTSNIPRYLIAQTQTEHLLGIFCSLAAVMQSGTLVFRAVDQVVAPRLARLLDARDVGGFLTLALGLLTLFVLLAVLGGIASLVFGPPLLTLVFSAEFSSWSPLLALMLGVAAMGQAAGILEQSLIAMRKTAVQLPMHLCTLASCTVCGFLWIPRFGLYGAVLAMIVSRIPFMVIGVVLLRHWFAKDRLTANVPPDALHSPGRAQDALPSPLPASSQEAA